VQSLLTILAEPWSRFFWRFYELVENITEEELQEYAIERIFDEIDALKL
jgi:hypothetical protein